MNFIPYIPEVVTLLLAAHALALAIGNLTGTPKDDEYLATFYRFVEFAAGIVNPDKAKQ